MIRLYFNTQCRSFRSWCLYNKTISEHRPSHTTINCNHSVCAFSNVKGTKYSTSFSFDHRKFIKFLIERNKCDFPRNGCRRPCQNNRVDGRFLTIFLGYTHTNTRTQTIRRRRRVERTRRIICISYVFNSHRVQSIHTSTVSSRRHYRTRLLRAVGSMNT